MKGRFTFISLLLIFSITSLAFAAAADCWSYDSSNCDEDSDCMWFSDEWSDGGWCGEMKCWNLNSQTQCDNISSSTNLTCQWKSSSNWGWCGQTNCYTFSGTNESLCEENSDGLNCQWNNYCQGYNPSVDCWSLDSESECSNNTGCKWGDCQDKGCWNYGSGDCALNNGSRGQPCQWNSQYDYCYERECWDFGGSGSNESNCENNSAGLTCVWVDNYYVQESCEQPSCYHFDNTNSSSCASNVYGLNCTWDGQWCNMVGCWNLNEQTECDGSSGCSWEVSSGGGWCEESQCWDWDSWQGGNQTQCEGNVNNLSCAWQDDPIGTSGIDGWCVTNLTTSCSSFATESDCMDTYFCWWEYVDWNNVTAGGSCNEPSWGTGNFSDEGFFGQWNPGCYIFDMNASDCEKVVGCNYANGLCDPADENSTTINITAQFIQDNGINCSMINDSQLCSNIPALSTCCEWSSGVCQEKLDKSCWENADKEQQELGIESCEDVSMVSNTPQQLCEQISGYPLFMPCVWDNSTSKCGFKAEQVFGNQTQSLSLIQNNKNCEAAGGKWTQEWYCEGNQSVPAGRCEQKADEERNCDKACFACEYKFDGSAHNSTQAAREYCYSSKLGFCEFIEDSSVPNGYGLCKAKDEFKKGIATDCKADCGSCTYQGNPNSASSFSGASKSYDVCNTPKCFCEQAYEFGSVKCKWVEDSVSDLGGYCVDSTEKTCADSCDRCYGRTDCLNTGRQALNASGSCEWTTESGESSSSETEGICRKMGESSEICWDGTDNDNDGMIDCADSGCFADSSCGMMQGDCFGWFNQDDCEVAQLASGQNCTWVQDPWGSWCDFPGADCWKSDGNSTACGDRDDCQWSEGSGTGWCEQDWDIGMDCFNKMTEDSCDGAEGCTWTNDTWCSGEGQNDTWCQDVGGWCDPDAFAPKGCWQYDGDVASCNSTDGCVWDVDGEYCYEQGCWNYDNNITACGEQQDCAWETSDWQSCEVDWSMDCWKYDGDPGSCTGGCVWRNDTWDPEGWCDNKFASCEDHDKPDCLVNSDTCTWCSDCWNWKTDTQGMCQGSCFDKDLDENACTQISGCKWSEGWCMMNTMGGGGSSVDCWQYSEDLTCTNVTGCKWKDTGWCDPVGFGGGGAATGGGGGSSGGLDCWKYDGNESTCTNSSLIGISCSWMQEPWPFCEPNWASDCWQYDWNQTGCDESASCYWNDNFGGGWCGNIADICWNNMSYSDMQGNDTEECNLNPNCNWTFGFGGGMGEGWCEPNCFAAQTQGECSGNCRWVDGWCNPPGMGAMFDGMETGAPIMLGNDDCMSEISESYVDICGVGIKDMGNAFGFGTGVADFSQAGICDQEKVGFFGFGNGNETVKYYVYLDTDGSTSGGCALSHNQSAKGYEFFLKYISEYNETLGKATESFTAKKCSSSGWAVADIGLSTWKQKMCSEIGGPMIAVEKSDLEKFPSLYSSEEDIRVFVSLADSLHNATTPSDVLSQAGWFTPGAIDFEINNLFDYGADSAKYEGIMQKGYVQYEDCFNGVDDDGDGNVDCDDWDCETTGLTNICYNEGVNEAGYSDTGMPTITGIKIEEYYDAALIMYYTDKPTNGTLTFWHNDSTCSSTPMNRSVLDSTRLSSVKNYTLWHDANIYNDTGVNSLDYPLQNNTQYYYKISVCDSVGRCSGSKCTSFMTAGDQCGYCDFVTLLQAPSGWNVYYDLDIDGTYEHGQGDVCGPKAGMKTDYASGRKANIKIEEEGGDVYMEFINVTLTKTGLSAKIRQISNSSDLIHDTTEGHVGMPSSTRDKIINNLHPESCRIKIPFSGTCDKLYHCDDSGDGCVDRTSEATLISAANCLWEIPYCEFSTWDEDGNAAVTPPGTSDTGGGTASTGGAAAGTGRTYTLTEEEFSLGSTKYLGIGDKFKFTISNESHSVVLDSFTENTATITVQSDPQTTVFFIDEEKKFDVTGDNYYDLSVKLDSINQTTNYTQTTVKGISEEIVAEVVPTTSPGGDLPGETPTTTVDEGKEGTGILIYVVVIGIIVVIVIVVLIILFSSKKKGKNTKKAIK